MSLARETTHANKKIELILLLQTHNIKQPLNHDCEKMVVFSQLKIMQTLMSDGDCKSAAILYEGNSALITPQDRNAKTTHILKQIFPNYYDLNALDFNHLTQNQQNVLFDNASVTLLHQLGLINFIYPVEDIGCENAGNKYTEAYQENLAKFPSLISRALKMTDNGLMLSCITLQDQLACKALYKTSFSDNPARGINREKTALDYVIQACSQTNNQKAVLIFGRNHAEGIRHLIETQFNDQIELKKIIDTTMGCPVKCNIEWFQKINQEALFCKDNKNYKDAIVHFKHIAEFWHATPSSTPRRDAVLLDTEFHLGTTLLLESATNLSEAVEHLKTAHHLANTCGQKNTLYTEHYDEALSKLLAKSKKDRKQTLSFLLADRINNTNPWNVYKEAVQKYRTGKYNTAIVMLNQAYRQFKITPSKQPLGKNSKECLLCQDTLIACYRDSKNYDKAIQYAEKAIGYYCGKQDIQNLIKKYHECLTSRQDDPKTIYAEAKQHFEEKGYPLALYKLTFVLKSHSQALTPDEKESCHSILSACYQALKSYDEDRLASQLAGVLPITSNNNALISNCMTK